MQTELLYKLTTLRPELTFAELSILCMLGGICFMLGFILTEYTFQEIRHYNQNSCEKIQIPLRFHIMRILLCTVCLLIVLYAICLFETAQIAKTHGCPSLMKYEKNMKSIWTSIEQSPEESLLPDSLSDNALLLYYRFGCKDCELLYQTLSEQVNDLPDVYWIATRSKQGKNLRKTYPVEDVPSGVAVHKNKTALTLPLYQKNNGKISLDQKNLTALIKHYRND